MAHIAMVSIPAPGHVNPSLEIIRELVGRGHRVTYANDPLFADTVRSVGAEFVPYRTTLPVQDDDGWGGDAIDALRLFLDDAIAMLPQLRAAYEDDRPDLFLYDIAGAPARILGAQWGIPAVQLSSTFVAWEGYEDDMRETTDAMKADPRGAEMYRVEREWLAANGQPPVEGWMGRPERSLVLVPRALQPNADRVGPQYTFVGPCIAPRPEQGEWTRPAGAEKVLLVSLGSAFTDHPDFYRRCVEAFGDLPGWHVVLQIGKYVDPAVLGDVPASVEVHSWVPQLAILEQADAFLTHAGMGGSSEGLWTGTPMIAAPQAVDQFANADALVTAGVARRVDSATVTAGELRAALLQLTGSAEVAARSAEIRRELREQGGTAEAVRLVEQELAVAAAVRPPLGAAREG
ncbi:macrolide family glycosyltransferase [Pseudonocardia cypriaca]|uniref:MGT family glycosyltransferase n=1 Tax=Pseudonocardia cypriaca TaxID=882449 RepID=A0A543FU83_9PSEU|nr:macrolide family glycosyltransferase [Pseudonocardia cypriaca]TQM37294.1 MGT family glycosyltransferase [Pseudonocardia cypriaca]